MTTAGQLARDIALGVVEANASESWKRDAREAVAEVALREASFTSDAVWLWLRLNSPARTHEHRALGAIMQWAHKEGIIEPTEAWVQSQSAQQHARPLRVWRSRIFKGVV